jgi:hypothetical protein
MVPKSSSALLVIMIQSPIFLAKYFFIAVLALGSMPAFSQVSISIGIAPPPLQLYSQPPCPDDGYIWTPGYWAYGDDAYYWVPGAWVQPPQFGVLWTPPYWGWNGNAYLFHSGYWGSSVGYYGGINYGYGYGGNGYGGGRWRANHFYYNTAVNNVSSTRVHYSYADRTAITNHASRVSYNGGKGGLKARPTARQRQLAAQHNPPTPAQQTLSRNPQVATGNSTGNFSDRPIPAVKPTPQEMPAPRTFASHSPAVQPEKTQAGSFQAHPPAVDQPRPRPLAQAKPQSHLAPHAQPQTRAQPQRVAQPQGRGDKAQAH